MRTCVTAWSLGAALLVLSPYAASARDFCPDRPGIDNPPCTIEPGKLSAEVSLGDWTHDTAGDTISDVVLIGDVGLRYGIADHAEVRIGWTAFGHSHSRDRPSGIVDTLSGTGDLTLGLKRNLLNPDGSGFSIAFLPSVSLPTGGKAIGAGDWSAGLQIPMSRQISDSISLTLTPEVDATVDTDRSGRHLAYGTAGGIAISPAPGLNVSIEGEVVRDEDPAGASTIALAGLAAGLMLGDRTQIDFGSEFGLNHSSPESHFYFGIARRF